MTEFSTKIVPLLKEIATIHGEEKIREVFGISKPTLRRWIAGESEPHHGMFDAIIKELEKLKISDK